MDIQQIFSQAIHDEASDIFIVAGIPLSFKIHGEIRPVGDLLKPVDTESFLQERFLKILASSEQGLND